MSLPWHIPLEMANGKKERTLKPVAPQPTFFKHLCNLDINDNPCEEIKTGLMCEIGIINKDTATIQRLIASGLTIVRLKLHELDSEVSLQVIQSIRQAVYNYSAELDYVYPLAVIVDVRDPDIMTGELKDGRKSTIDLVENETIRLTTDITWRESGTIDCLYVGYDQLTELKPGDIIFIDSLTPGKIKLIVSQVGDDSLECLIAVGGTVGPKMAVRISHVPRETIKKVIPDDDSDTLCAVEQPFEHMEDQLAWAIGSDVDAVLVPNTRNTYDIECVRNILVEKGKHLLIFACIECAQGYDNIDAILAEADGLYIDRCALSTDIPIEKIFIAQKAIVAKCNEAGKPCICKAVINEQIPTLCVTDIANLIIDGVDVISLELHYNSPLKKFSPVYESIKMAEHCLAATSIVCRHAENIIWQPIIYGNMELMQSPIDGPTKALCISAVELASRSQSVAIICTTHSGRTAKLLSHAKPPCPIIAVTRICQTARQMRFWRGIRAMHYFEPPKANWSDEVDARICGALDYCKSKRILEAGDPYVVVTGSRRGVGYTDTVKLLYASVRNTIPAD